MTGWSPGTAPIGTLAHDGYEWRWTPLPGSGPPVIGQTTPGKLPPFIVSLLPEGWLEEALPAGTSGFESLPVVEWRERGQAVPMP